MAASKEALSYFDETWKEFLSTLSPEKYRLLVLEDGSYSEVGMIMLTFFSVKFVNAALSAFLEGYLK